MWIFDTQKMLMCTLFFGGEVISESVWFILYTHENVDIYEWPLRYTTFQYYIETKFCAPVNLVSSSVWCKNCLNYKLENGHFDLDKTWNVMAENKNWEPCPG